MCAAAAAGGGSDQAFDPGGRWVWIESALTLIELVVFATQSGERCISAVSFLQTLQTRLLRYESPAYREQEVYFSCARNLARAQFQLADHELSRRLWQDVADRELDVDRILNLMYGCWFQDEIDSMQESDRHYFSGNSKSPAQPDKTAAGIFEHC